MDNARLRYIPKKRLKKKVITHSYVVVEVHIFFSNGRCIIEHMIQIVSFHGTIFLNCFLSPFIIQRITPH